MKPKQGTCEMSLLVFCWVVFISALILRKACPQLATEGTACSSYSFQCGSCFIWDKRAHKTVKAIKEVWSVSDHWDVLQRNPKASAGAESSHMAASPDRSNQLVSLCVSVCVESVLCSRTLLPFLYKGWMEPLFWRATSWEPFSVFNECWVT